MKNPVIILFTISLNIFCSWSQIQIGNDIYGDAAEDYFGTSVSLSSDGFIVAVGAPFNNNNTGLVSVYENLSGVWTQMGNDIYGESVGDLSGQSVSLSSDGTTLAVGAIFNNNVNGNNLGHVRIFKYSEGNWTQIGNDIDGKTGDTFFGWSVSLSDDGNIVAIGAPSNHLMGLVDSHIRIYENIQGVWTQIGNDIIGDTNWDAKGWSVSLSSDGNIVAIGEPGTSSMEDSSGEVSVYEKIEGDWIQIGDDIAAENQRENFGWSVSLASDGNIVAIGAPGTGASGINNDFGYVRIYKNISGNWTQLGNEIESYSTGDFFGGSVSLSSDGSLVAVGAFSDDSNGSDSGAARIYKNISGIWTQIGNVIEGETPNNALGQCVSISSDGSVVAIGAPANDTYAENSGQVKIFDLSALLSTNEYVKAEFKVYPNPTSNELNIQLNNGLELQRVNLYNVLGQIVNSSNELSIDVSNLNSGLYYIQIVTEKDKITKKVIIE